MAPSTSFRVAAIQAAPCYMDVQASLDKACALIKSAAQTGAVVAAFSEAWLPGFPFFLFSALDRQWWRAAARYLEATIEVPGPETDALCAAARDAGIDVVIGVVERDSTTQGSAYCTILFIGREGKILGRHRKTRPTLVERAIWADGDARGLVVHERSYGRISALNCWEHNSVLPGYALMAQGTQVHFALWPGREQATAPAAPEALYSRQLLLSRAFASQAASYVVCVGGLRTKQDVPEEFVDLQIRDTTGDSYIIDPRGEVIVGPGVGETILTAECDPELLRAAKVACDVAGHYGRKDLFEFSVRAS
ncbi:carbon-nitrogen hydrolase family protein [Variovorax sp. J31P179]|uniref:carbon-nitrogen hydrolase family protein n=1 Tax=Variovorax sp. J31P179 TaxID=3053508 RepID=UPI002577F4FC|nr:carbon-nitrogen hydrolase family protein [Variovorax sp. J31P179]MDM0085370.1 carbon-nitrogen hydrolase family protein [Variovorax sp. J31P179]